MSDQRPNQQMNDDGLTSDEMPGPVKPIHTVGFKPLMKEAQPTSEPRQDEHTTHVYFNGVCLYCKQPNPDVAEQDAGTLKQEAAKFREDWVKTHDEIFLAFVGGLYSPKLLDEMLAAFARHRDEQLKPYLHHNSDRCYYPDSPCTCGLERLLKG